jgi:soluble lytic murein transglycosylase-like protein
VELPGASPLLTDLVQDQARLSRAQAAVGRAQTGGPPASDDRSRQESELAALRQVASQFEALFYNQLLSAMRETVPENSLWGKDSAAKTYRQMHDDALAERLAEGGRLGIADLIVQQFRPATAPGEGRTSGEHLPEVRRLPDPRGFRVYGRATKVSAATARFTQLQELAAQVGSATADTLQRYQGELTAAASAADLDPGLVLAVVMRESAGDPAAVSHRGAEGLMQLMPGTARELGVTDPADPLQNLQGGSRYLAGLLRRYDGDLDLALAAYNAGPGTVDRLGRRIPDYPETRRYVAAVKELAQRLGYRSGTNLDKE